MAIDSCLVIGSYSASFSLSLNGLTIFGRSSGRLICRSKQVLSHSLLASSRDSLRFPLSLGLSCRQVWLKFSVRGYGCSIRGPGWQLRLCRFSESFTDIHNGASGRVTRRPFRLCSLFLWSILMGAFPSSLFAIILEAGIVFLPWKLRLVSLSGRLLRNFLLRHMQCALLSRFRDDHAFPTRVSLLGTAAYPKP